MLTVEQKKAIVRYISRFSGKAVREDVEEVEDASPEEIEEFLLECEARLVEAMEGLTT